jgi:hypothetical protein
MGNYRLRQRDFYRNRDLAESRQRTTENLAAGLINMDMVTTIDAAQRLISQKARIEELEGGSAGNG